MTPSIYKNMQFDAVADFAPVAKHGRHRCVVRRAGAWAHTCRCDRPPESRFVELMNSDDVKAALAKQGLSVCTNSPAQLAAIVKRDLARWKKVATDARIEAD